MKIAVEGCCHGELDKIYETIAFLENKQGIKVDLLLCCGDFQAVRNPSDLGCMAVPPKYQKMNTFYKYYSGEKKAPILTIFIGGNHEASNYLQELAYGGWVAPNIYYLGYAGVVQMGGVRIGGISGIYKGRDYIRGRYEHLPFTEDSKRSVYHIRNLDVFRLKQLSRPVDIFLSHDWPAGVYNHGNYQQLARFKPYFADEMAANTLGSPPGAEVLYHMKPKYWFAAHLHAKFAARVQHESFDGSPKETRFLALDKCLPKRRFLQLLDIPHDTNKKLKLELDAEWLCVLKATNHLMKVTPSMVYMPGPGGKEEYDFTVNDKEISDIKEDFGGDLSIPDNFERIAEPYYTSQGPAKPNQAPAPRIHINPQTTLMCEMLGITDPVTHFTNEKPTLNLPADAPPLEANPDEIPVDDADSCSEGDSSEETPVYDSFIISHDASAFGLSTSKLDDSLDEKYVTAYQSMSEISPGDSAGSGLVGISETTEHVSQDDGASSPPQGMMSPPQGMMSPPQGMMSPPATSGEEQSSDKDSSAYLSPPQTGGSTSPKRPLEAEIELAEPAEALFSSPKDSSITESSDAKPKKFKRRNQSFYQSDD